MWIMTLSLWFGFYSFSILLSFICWSHSGILFTLLCGREHLHGGVGVLLKVRRQTYVQVFHMFSN